MSPVPDIRLRVWSRSDRGGWQWQIGDLWLVVGPAHDDPGGWILRSPGVGQAGSDWLQRHGLAGRVFLTRQDAVRDVVAAAAIELPWRARRRAFGRADEGDPPPHRHLGGHDHPRRDRPARRLVPSLAQARQEAGTQADWDTRSR